MARTGWGAMGYEITTGSNDATKIISKDRWNLPIDKGAGILGFDAQTEVGHATSIVPSKSVLILSGSTETGLFGLADSEQYDVLWVFTSGTVALTNQTSTVDADGQIVGLGSASTITLSQTIPKIFIRRTVGSYDAWIEYGGGASVSANDLTGTELASGVVTTAITTVGTIGSGTWQGTAIADGYLGTGINADKIADASVSSTEFQRLDGVTSDIQGQIDAKQASLTFGIADTNKVQIDGSGTSTGQYSKFTATGVIGASASTQKTDLSLNNVENTALSTWAGTTNVVTIGTVTTGTWTGTAIADDYGGTGQTTYATGDIIYASGSNTLAKLTAGSNTHVLTLTGGVPVWAAGGGGAHTEQEWDVYDPASFTPTPAVANTEAYMYTEEIDSDNDGLFIQMWKNGASQAVQIA